MSVLHTCVLLLLVLFTRDTYQEESTSTPEGHWHVYHNSDKWKFVTAEDELYHNLLQASYYNKNSRPITTGTQRMNVSLLMSLMKIVELDVTTEMFTADIILTMFWNDFRLAWNYTEHKIDSIRLPWQDIWTPDVTLWNSAESETKPPESQLAVVWPSGNVLWSPHIIAKVHCSPDPGLLLRDSQQCFLFFGSWTYDFTKIRFSFLKEHEPISVDFLTPDNLWHVKEKGAYIEKVSFENGTWSTQVVVFNMTLERRTSFRSTGQVQATKVVTFLVPLMFLVPHSSCHNVLLGATILVCNSLALVVNEISLPLQNHLSKLPATQALTSMGFTVVAVFISIILQRLYQEMSPARTLPNCIRRVIYSRLGKCLCFVCADHYSSPYPNAQNLQTVNGSPLEDEHQLTEPPAHATRQGDWQIFVKFLERLFFLISMLFAIIICVYIDSDGIIMYVYEV